MVNFIIITCYGIVYNLVYSLYTQLNGAEIFVNKDWKREEYGVHQQVSKSQPSETIP